MAKKSERRERKRGVRREGRHEAESKLHQRGGEFTCFTIPEGLTVWKPEKDKTYHIDVLPYIAGKYNKAAHPGDEFYVLTYPVYRSLGIEEKPFVAIGDLLGVKDPIQEHFAALRKSGAEWDDMKMFRSAERQLWLVFVHEQADKGLQLYDASYQTFGKLLKEEIDDSGEVEWIDNFDDIAGGATMKVRFKGEQVMTNTWVKATKITFIEREDGFTADGDPKLADKILDLLERICLDDLLKIPTYDILKAALDGEPTGTEDDDDEDEAPKGRRDRAAKPAKKAAKAKPEPEEGDDEEEEDETEDDLPFDDDDEEEDDEPPAKPAKKARKQPTAADLGIVKGATVTHDEYGDCRVLRVAEDGLTVSIKDDDGNVYRDIDPADLEPADEDDEPEEKPAPKKKAAAKPAKKPKAPEPEEDDEDEDDEPPAKAKKAAKGKPAKKATEAEEWDDDWED